jgi:hypothetical protein
MCTNANKVVENLLAALKIPIDNLLAVLNVPATTIASVDAAYNAALAALQNFTPGTALETAIQAVEALDSVFNALPVPDLYKGVAAAIAAAIAGILGTLEGLAPAPAGVTAEAHLAHATAETAARVQAILPGYKSSWTERVLHPDSWPVIEFRKQVNTAWVAAGHPEFQV